MKVEINETIKVAISRQKNVHKSETNWKYIKFADSLLKSIKMKKVFNLSLMVATLLATSLFTSCSKEEENPDKPQPTISVEVLGKSSSDIEVGKSEAISFRWNVIKAGGGSDLKEFSISQQGINVLSDLPETAKGKSFANNKISLSGSDKTQYVDTLTIYSGDNLGTTTYTFKIEDKDGNIVTKVIKVTVSATANETPLATTKDGAFWHAGGSKDGAYDLDADKSVASNSAAANRDMTNNDKAGDAFTGSFTAANSTEFVKANSYDYANATVESAATAYAGGTASATVSNPQTNDIYIAKFRGGDDYVVIKITAVDPVNNDCACGNKGKITFEYKKK
ncbi:MAG: hypothetical protein M0R38_11265 [Bacteroidia bacterium]|nr:hypothetical protein [Bacteroidia bacterium]